MAKKFTLTQVILELKSPSAVLVNGNAKKPLEYARGTYDRILLDAVEYLKEYEAMLDAGSVADMGLAEVGSIIRSQRERIAFLDREREEAKDAAARFEYEARRAERSGGWR